MTKLRLDTLLAQRGLFASRARAAASVMAGEVRLGGSGGERAAKPGQMVAEDVEVAVDERPRFVSRGGIKLANALDATGIDPAGRGADVQAPAPRPAASPTACCSAAPRSSVRRDQSSSP